MQRLLSLVALIFASTVHAQALSPQEALKKMKLPDGFKAKVVAHEPMIRQPVSISFDDRGRMWVLQYLQYPNYEGLKPLKQDQYLRTIWDRVPEPPPKGPKGLDRITILSDPDENGVYRKSKDFVTGLNIASGFCIGNDGVYVAQPPYLLFYPDKNHDDIPDGDPEVLLTGFGMDDTHSLANSLQWGPDGWLYGAGGSTSTSKIANPANPKEIVEFQQGIWRYHPSTKRFEMFSEGGGNTYGLDFDRYGRCIAGTNWGGKAMLHQFPGAYYVKGFSKHGPLHNPYTYGYFDHVPYENFKGGHVTCGGIVYEADAYPKEYRGQYIAANLLSNAIYWHKMEEKGSSFTAKHGGDLMTTSDQWFRPVDCYLGPDGSVYVADWYDKRAAHLDPLDTWDKTNGRIYKIEYEGTKPVGEFDLRKKSVAELVELLKHPNKWWRGEARRLMVAKWGGQLEKPLKDLIKNGDSVTQVEALWALFQVERFNPTDLDYISLLLKHPNEQVRAWTVRFLGETQIPQTLQSGVMRSFARTEPSPTVRIELAAAIKRLPIKNTMTGWNFYELMNRKEDLGDPFQPLMLWWAIEAHVDDFDYRADWDEWSFRDTPIYRKHIYERLVRRLASADNNPLGLDFVLKEARSAELGSAAFRGIEAALEGGSKLTSIKEPAAKLALLQKYVNPELFERVMARLGDPFIRTQLVQQIGDEQLASTERIRKINLLGNLREKKALPMLRTVFATAKSDEVKVAAVNALQHFADDAAANDLLVAFPKLTGNLRTATKNGLLARPKSALELLKLVETGKLAKTEFQPDELRPALEFKDAELTKLIEKHYGKIAAATPGEKQARISWLGIQLGKEPGNAAKGKEIFTKQCAVCHQLFGEGGKVGPDLTPSDRKNTRYLLTHIVDPSLYVRPEFVTYDVVTQDGRRLSGLVAEMGETLTLSNVVNNEVRVVKLAKGDIESIKPSPTSVMPEKLLDTISEDEVRHLFAHLQSEPKKEPAPKEAPKQPQAFKEGTKKLKVLLVSGSVEYESDKSLAILQNHLEANYPIQCVWASRNKDDDLPGLENLEKCDLAIFFTRRLTIDGEQLQRVKKYAASGKPIIGIRTASHGFQKWLEMDKEIYGGDYKNHHGHDLKTELAIAEKAKDHPILKGVKLYQATGGLYKNAEVARDVTVLLTGTIPKYSYPVAWTREVNGARIFYTSLGHQEDFKEANFIKLIVNAIYWTTKTEPPK